MKKKRNPHTNAVLAIEADDIGRDIARYNTRLS